MKALFGRAVHGLSIGIGDKGYMRRAILCLACSFMCFLLAAQRTVAQVDVATEYYQHQMPEKAKDLLILALNDRTSTPAIKAQSLYLLGQISFEEKNYSAAFTDWQKLVKQYPQSSEALEINKRLPALREAIQKFSDATLSSSAATAYIDHGDFWSKGDRIFMIDSSFLSDVELANYWYDRTISEFPNTDAAELAYQRKMFALLGWKDLGEYGQTYGVRANFAKYMPQLLQTFADFEKAFPNSSYLQGFRFQIGQEYWKRKEWASASDWFQKVVNAGQGEKTFYTETAAARLQKLQY
jgi:tetratricopeptide (TPR) repeat protein